MKRIADRAHRLSKRVMRLEHPLHMGYFGAGSIYYAVHEVLWLAGLCGALFFVFLNHYLAAAANGGE